MSTAVSNDEPFNDREHLFGEPTSEGDESSDLHFSRECPMCNAPSPHQRSVFSSCGHMVCRACAAQVELDKIKQNRAELLCPYCRCEGQFVELVEERIAEKSVVKNEGCCNVFSFTIITRLIDCIRDKTGNKVKREALSRARKEYNTAYAAYNTAREEHVKAYEEAMEAYAAAEAATDAAETTREAARTHQTAALSGPYVQQALAYALAMNHQRTATAQYKIVAANATTARLSALAAQISLFHALDELNFARERRDEEKRTAVVKRFTRCCRACETKSPRHRSFFPSCGHAVCRACAERQASRAAEADNICAGCPFCEAPGGFVPLYEEQDENEVFI